MFGFSEAERFIFIIGIFFKSFLHYSHISCNLSVVHLTGTVGHPRDTAGHLAGHRGTPRGTSWDTAGHLAGHRGTPRDTSRDSLLITNGAHWSPNARCVWIVSPLRIFTFPVQFLIILVNLGRLVSDICFNVLFGTLLILCYTFVCIFAHG